MKSLQKALNDYTQNKNGNFSVNPTVDKEELIAQILRAVADAKQLLADNSFSLDALVAATNFTKLELLADGAEAMCNSPETKKSFDTYSAKR